ncbi:MAG TPA: HEPN domain-containing protein [Candidatus Nanoarchaeia archaeon]|nr:HEPN domain-containing protein [Candidatus Nanoarchaeia archaeon]
MTDKIKDCLKSGEKGERHKGLRKVKTSEVLIKGHLRKAIHNFNAIEEFYKSGYSDWSASASFYSLYHCLLAILAKNGIESRNQTCTFAFIEQMINDKKLSITKEELSEIFDKDITEDLMHSNKILDIRENMQYSIKTSLERKEFDLLKQRTKELLDKLRREIEK